MANVPKQGKSDERTVASQGIRRRNLLVHVACVALMLLAVELAQQRGGDWFRWTASTDRNPGLQEGLAWRLGRLDLRARLDDTALIEEEQRVYNVFPPLQSIIGLVAAFFTVSPDAVPPLGEMPVYRWLPLLVFFVPLPIVAYRVFFHRTGSAFWAAVMTAALIGGTAVAPCIEAARLGYVYQANHLLAAIGLLLFAGEYLGRRRIGILLLGLLIASWSRQLTAAFAMAMLYALWVDTRGTGPAEDRSAGTRAPAGRVLFAICGLLLIAGVPMALNAAKFGGPLDSGYLLIYEGRDGTVPDKARAYGVFSSRFVPTNAWYMNLDLPWSRGEDGALAWRPSEDGGSLWLSTPLAAMALAGATWWRRDRRAAALMLCSVPIVAAHLMYHNTGYLQTGYYRFALDYLPVWMVVAAPWLCTGWRRVATLACTVWSLAYFAMVSHWTTYGY